MQKKKLRKLSLNDHDYLLATSLQTASAISSKAVMISSSDQRKSTGYRTVDWDKCKMKCQQGW